ncbi:MAG: hypothetical protein EBV42_00835 [Actinobacteria bacterium]|nr:hypothetical protein [Actinomycetota bacterium]
MRLPISPLRPGCGYSTYLVEMQAREPLRSEQDAECGDREHPHQGKHGGDAVQIAFSRRCRSTPTIIPIIEMTLTTMVTIVIALRTLSAYRRQAR